MKAIVPRLIVTADPNHPARGTLWCGSHIFACVLGRAGIRADKHEGDGATPPGCYALRRVLYRADILDPPLTALPVSVIARDDGWCDAAGDPRYNRPVKLPYPASAENMWRDDRLYDVVVVLGHNDEPVIPGAGSAIFMHIAAPDGSPTAGCVALKHEDLVAVLAEVGPETVIEIRS